MNFEELARETLNNCIKDHDNGGWHFAGLNEIVITQFSQALKSAYSAGLEEAYDKARHMSWINGCDICQQAIRQLMETEK